MCNAKFRNTPNQKRTGSHLFKPKRLLYRNWYRRLSRGSSTGIIIALITPETASFLVRRTSNAWQLEAIKEIVQRGNDFLLGVCRIYINTFSFLCLASSYIKLNLDLSGVVNRPSCVCIYLSIYLFIYLYSIIKIALAYLFIVFHRHIIRI